MGGYRYNSDNSIYHMYMISHASAYFVFDSIIEIAYGTADMLTNVHHVVVLFVSYFGMKAPHSGFEYLSNTPYLNHLALHLLAEVSNPFLILRTILKILGKKDSTIYKVNDMVFAVIFLIARVLLTPFFLIYMFEGHNVIYSIKLGVSFILYVQLLWAYRIIYLIFDGFREPYKKKEKKAPAWIENGF